MKEDRNFIIASPSGFFHLVVIRFFLLDTQNTFGQLRIMSSPQCYCLHKQRQIGKVPFEDKYKAGSISSNLFLRRTQHRLPSWQRKITVRKKSLTTVSVELKSNDISTAGDVFDVVKADTSLEVIKGR